MSTFELSSDPDLEAEVEFGDLGGAGPRTVHAFISRVEALASVSLRGASEVTRMSDLDGITRSLTLQAIDVLLGHPPTDLVRTIDTFGDAFAWWMQRSTGAHPSSTPVYGPAVLRAPGCYLRPVTPDDYPVLYAAAVDPIDGYRWRFRGATPAPSEFEHLLFHEAIAQFVVCDAEDDSAHGLVVAYGYHAGDGHANVAYQRIGGVDRRAGQMIVGIGLLIEYVFATWPVRKLYADLPDFNFGPLAALTGTAFEVEGRRRDHLYHADAWHDLVTIAIYREPWRAFMDAWWSELSTTASIRRHQG